MSKRASSISSTNVSEKGIGAVSSDLDVAAQLATGGPEETISTEDALRLR